MVVVISITAFMRKHSAVNNTVATAGETLIQHSLANVDLVEKSITIGLEVLQVELAESAEEKATGLSHRADLSEGKGMLFIYKEEGDYAIWMKDMHFSIDIVWIDKNYQVVHIEDSITPESYPETFSSSIPAQFILEVPAGYADKRIAVGDFMRF